MSQGTKDKIINAALHLFNQEGLVNVRLQHIADEAFVSVGNLAYHFPNKEAIVSKIHENLTKKQEELLTQFRVVPLFDNIDRLFDETFALQSQYIFFYLDTLEILRSYPSIIDLHRNKIQTKILQLKSMFDFNVSRGALMPEQIDGIYENLASQVWMTMDNWLSTQVILGNKKIEQSTFKNSIWLLLYPHFTDMGRLEYKQMLDRPYDFFL